MRMRTSGVANDLIQQSLLGDAIDAGPVAVFVADEDQRYLAVNDYACRLLGYSREELLALTVTEVAVNPSAPEDYARMLSQGRHVGRTLLRCKDGTELEMAFRAGETTVGGMDVYVGVCWPLDGAD
jgi:PAS domain S-box-containing protein